jgi:hypothetical protein
VSGRAALIAQRAHLLADHHSRGAGAPGWSARTVRLEPVDEVLAAVVASVALVVHNARTIADRAGPDAFTGDVGPVAGQLVLRGIGPVLGQYDPDGLKAVVHAVAKLYPDVGAEFYRYLETCGRDWADEALDLYPDIEAALADPSIALGEFLP